VRLQVIGLASDVNGDIAGLPLRVSAGLEPDFPHSTRVMQLCRQVFG